MQRIEDKVSEYIDTIEMMLERDVEKKRRERIKRLMVEQIVKECKNYVDEKVNELGKNT